MKRFFTLLFMFFNIINIFSQNLTVIVKDKENNSLPGATVKLLKVADNTEKYSTTDNLGSAIFSDIKNGLYKVNVSFVAYQTFEKVYSVNEGFRRINIYLSDDKITLSEVTVEAKAPLLRQEGDKMIIDPESLEGVSSNTLEVLESTPGLYVDQDGGVFLNSAVPAKIYINGREQKMSNQDITTILQSLPPNSVLRIEIIRTPSSKYDASSTGGIINIVLKKGVKLSRFGSVNGAYSRAKYNSGDFGFSLNDSGDKYSIYLNSSYRYNDREEILNATRQMKIDTFFVQESDSRNKSHNSFISYGINYEPNEKWTFSYDGRFNFSNPKNFNTSTGLSNNIFDEIFSKNTNTINNKSEFFNLQQDINLTRKIDTLGSLWENKISYNYSNRNMNQEYMYDFILPYAFIVAGSGNNFMNRNYVSFESDLNLQLKFRLIFESGIKATYQYFKNNSDFWINQGGINISDPIRTNYYYYDESINAAYLQVSKTLFKDFVLKTGVRAENTYMKGTQTIPRDTGFIVNRIDLFPYVYLSRTVFKMKDFELKAYVIYRKTINRPGYEMLNPNITIVDQYLYQKGNPALKPQFTDNVELNISYENFPVFAVGRNYTKDIFSGVVYQDIQNPAIAVNTYDNLGKSKETYLRVMVGIPPGGRYFFGAGTQYNLNEYYGFYQGEELNYSRGSWRIYTFHMLKIAKNTRLTLMGFMMINGQYDFYELENFGMLNLGLRQSYLNNKLTINIRFRDLLRSMNVKYSIHQGNVNAWGNRYTDNQAISINIRYNFGIGRKNDYKNMMQLEDEM